MCEDFTIVSLGDVSVRVKRLTLGEIRADRALMANGDAVVLDESRTKLIAEHVRLVDGRALNPEMLSLPQMQKLMKELVGLPESGGISDFIGRLC